MAPKIIRLSEEVINQIKAGEVVENPASIIKELIENSIDAGSSLIRVTIRSGGQLLIEVEDNGCGMSPEDALLSMERHATSKIKTADDLSFLQTMGFRGEAIAAIASVSHFEMKTSDGSTGTYIKAQGGAIEEVSPCARNQGTTITVKSLFYNTPARRKFQKSASSNASAVTRLIETVSLAHPEIHFVYFSGDEKIYDFKPASQKERIEAVLGPFAHEGKMDQMKGFFGTPLEAKSTRRGQYLFVNKRPIFSPIIAKAVQTGYATRLQEGMHPSFVLMIEIDPAKVDVNVHPQKKEVRFSHESELFSDVERLVRSIFDRESITAPVSSFAFEPFSFEAPKEHFFPKFDGNLPVFQTQKQFDNFPTTPKEKPIFAFGRFLLIEKEGLFLVDLEAARFRVFFDAVQNKTVQIQKLMFPIEVQDDEDETVLQLSNMGFECHRIAARKILIEATPSFLESFEVQAFFEAFKNGKKLENTLQGFTKSQNRNYSLEQAMHIYLLCKDCSDSLYDPSGKKIQMPILAKDFELLLNRKF